MKLLMISGDRTLATRKQGAFSEMLKSFAPHWERIDIVCPFSLTPSPSPIGRGEAFLPANVFVHSSPHGLWYQPFWIRKKGAELAKRFGHDVMTVHEYPPFYNGIGARMLRKKVKIPAALEIHHIVGWPVPATPAEMIGRLLSRCFLASHSKRFDAVRVVNATVRTLLCDWGVEEPLLHIVPSFYLDTALLKPDLSVKKEWDLVFCGRLVANKGLLQLLDAVSMLERVRLLIIGDGPLKKKAQAFVHERGLLSRVRFVGWLPTAADVVRALQSGRLFVMPSLSEGGPRSALEAMACGLPVVATRVGVMPDVIKDGLNGVFTTGEAHDLREKISALLMSPSKQISMGHEAAKIVHLFDRNRLIAGYADFLKQVSQHVS